jgi:hypothetical protein
MMSTDGAAGSYAFLRFKHAFGDGLHTYTARADSTLVNEVWRGLQDLAWYPEDPELDPMDQFCISNLPGNAGDVAGRGLGGHRRPSPARDPTVGP